MTCTATRPPLTAPSGRKTVDRDTRLETRIRNGLHSSGYLSLRRLRCDAVDGEVKLSGVVPSFHLKQVAQTIALNLDEVKRVRNRVEVRS